jgi:hypothetical protein
MASSQKIISVFIENSLSQHTLPFQWQERFVNFVLKFRHSFSDLCSLSTPEIQTIHTRLSAIASLDEQSALHLDIFLTSTNAEGILKYIPCTSP